MAMEGVTCPEITNQKARAGSMKIADTEAGNGICSAYRKSSSPSHIYTGYRVCCRGVVSIWHCNGNGDDVTTELLKLFFQNRVILPKPELLETTSATQGAPIL